MYLAELFVLQVLFFEFFERFRNLLRVYLYLSCTAGGYKLSKS